MAQDMTMADMHAKMQEALQKAVGTFLSNMDNMIRNRMEGAVAKVIGFSHGHYNGWDVDHCNGRNSLISGLISENAALMCKEELAKIITPELIAKVIDEAKAGIVADFRQQFQYKVTEAVRAIATREATAFAEKMAAEVMAQITLPTTMDIQDPKTGSDPITGAILKATVKRAMGGGIMQEES